MSIETVKKSDLQVAARCADRDQADFANQILCDLANNTLISLREYTNVI